MDAFTTSFDACRIVVAGFSQVSVGFAEIRIYTCVTMSDLDR